MSASVEPGSIVAAGVESLELLVGAVKASCAPEGVATRIVAVDGPGGAGKSTLATRLADELQAAVLPTDDFASWDNPIDWWAEARSVRPS